MTLLFGGAVLVAIWAFLIAWIARTAISQGRNLVIWSVIGGSFGIAGGGASVQILRAAMNASSLGSNWWLLSVLAPLACVALPMAALVLLLRRLPVRVARRASWRVHTPGKGEGTLSIDGGRVVLQWRELRHEVAVDALDSVRVDGETLRLAWVADGSEVVQVLMPMEAPQSRAGRQAQCAALARQLATSGARETARPHRR